MKRIKYSFFDEETKSIVYGEFHAVAFTASSWGVSFAVYHLQSDITSYSWDELNKMVGGFVAFTVPNI